MVSRASPKKQHEIPRVKLTCEFPIEIDYQGIVFPVKRGKQIKEAKEPHLRRAVKRCGVTVCIYTHHTMMITLIRGPNYLGGVKGAGCRKSEATSRSAASSRISSNRNWDANQRLARRHTTPKHPYCCWSLTCNTSYIYLNKPFAKTRMSVFSMFIYMCMLYPCKVLVRKGFCRVSSSSAWASALSL